MSYRRETKRCVNDVHDVGPLSANETPCWRCESEREDRITIALMTPVVLAVVLTLAAVMYMALGWWMLAIAAAAGWVFLHRRRTADLLDRFGGWVQRVMSGEVSS